jgi:hypothetical protein
MRSWAIFWLPVGACPVGLVRSWGRNRSSTRMLTTPTIDFRSVSPFRRPDWRWRAATGMDTELSIPSKRARFRAYDHASMVQRGPADPMFIAELCRHVLAESQRTGKPIEPEMAISLKILRLSAGLPKSRQLERFPPVGVRRARKLSSLPAIQPENDGADRVSAGDSMRSAYETEARKAVRLGGTVGRKRAQPRLLQDQAILPPPVAEKLEA